MVLLRCGGAAVLRCCGVAVWRCGGVAVLRCGGAVLSPPDRSSVALHGHQPVRSEASVRGGVMSTANTRRRGASGAGTDRMIERAEAGETE
jgi:hypothetical protein